MYKEKTKWGVERTGSVMKEADGNRERRLFVPAVVRRTRLILFLLLFAWPVFAQNPAAQEPESSRDALHAQRDDWRAQRDEWRARRQEWREQQRNTGRRHDGAHIRFGRDYNVAAGETASGPIILFGGSAEIDGRTDDDLVVIGGNVRLGPEATIGGDVVAIGGHTNIDPKAQVLGEVVDLSANMPALPWPRTAMSDRWWHVVGISITAVRVFAVLFAAAMLTLIFPQSIGRASGRLASSPASSLFLGLGTQIVFVPILVIVTLALIVSVIGIPLVVLLPMLLVLSAGVSVTGFTAVAVRAGAALRGRQVGDEPAVGDALTGVLALVAVSVVGRSLTLLGPSWMEPIGILVHGIGLCIEYLAWTVGLGAAATTLLSRRRAVPPLPPTTRAAWISL
jgi:hypothetical protein